LLEHFDWDFSHGWRVGPYGGDVATFDMRGGGGEVSVGPEGRVGRGGAVDDVWNDITISQAWVVGELTR